MTWINAITISIGKDKCGVTSDLNITPALVMELAEEHGLQRAFSERRLDLHQDHPLLPCNI